VPGLFGIDGSTAATRGRYRMRDCLPQTAPLNLHLIDIHRRRYIRAASSQVKFSPRSRVEHFAQPLLPSARHLSFCLFADAVTRVQ
jgi:hypothetical protein